MSVNTPSPLGDASSVASLPPQGHRGEVVKTGNLKKLKTNKKKYFVLRCESADYPARLEYYDNEKKFKAHQQPKRSISLKACFNINRRTDMKPKYVIALYTKDDCFCIVLESEEEREAWLRALWALQDGDDVTDGEAPKPVFEHVWKVEVANKGLGSTRGINGPYHLCLTGRTVSLVRILSDGSKDILEFPLINIRSFGCAESFFYMEVGRNAVTGTGEIWMLAEDAVIAKDMSRAIHAMRSRGDDRIRSDDSGSRQIARSASVSEPTRPISVTNRRHNNSASEKHDESETSVPNVNESTAGYVGNLDTYCEMRVPGRLVSTDHDGSALSRTGSVPYNFLYCQLSQRCVQQQQQQQCRVNNNILSHPNRRRHSVSGSSAGRDRSDSLPSTVRAPTENHSFSHGSMGTHGHHPHHVYGRTMHYISACHRPHSMYNRGISHSPPVNNSSPVSPASGACSTDSAGSSLSIDDGENWVDGTDGTLSSSISSRYPTNHPLTPESPIEEENCDDYVHWNGPSGLDSGVGDDEKMNNYMPMAPSAATLSLPIQQPHSGSARKYSPGRGSQGANLKAGTSPSHSNYMEMNSPCGSSPMDTPGNYMIMSPGNAPDNIRNSAFHNRNFQHTAPSSANHSRTSSLAEETPDGYVPMMPGQTDDGYVDMDPQSVDVHDDFHHGEMSPSSSCSITSGTPSTDLRFSEYPLEKVNSYLTPSEEEEHSEQRPARCYSVGSKPDSLNKKNRIDFINQTDCSRVRAFSVGSRNAGSKYMSRPLGHDIHATRHALQAGGHFTPPSQQRQQQGGGGGGKKSSSAPILSNPLSSSPMNRQILGGSHSSVEPMDDLMEMDFSPSVPSSSKINRNKNAGKTGGRSKSTCVNEYVAMSPADRLSVPSGGGGPSHHSSLSSVASSYSTAEGFDVVDHVGSPRTFDSIGPGSPPKTSVLRGVYSNSVGRSPPDSLARSPPSRSNVLPRSAVARMSCIAELKPQNFPMTTPSPPIKPSLLATNNSASSMAAKMAKMAVSSPYVEMNPSNATMKPVMATSSASKQPAESGPYVEMKGRASSGTSKATANVLPSSATNEDYLDMSFKPRRTSVPECKELSSATVTDGYVEMGWKASGESDLESNPRKTSLDSQKPTGNEDYMVMTGGGSSSRNRRERRGSTKRERNQFRSQPINIQQPQHNRKIMMDTPPKAPPGFLPLGSSLDSQSPLSSPFASLGRSRNREVSKDSSSTSTTTPTGSNSTIFPISLNSPCSPLAPFTEDEPSVTSASLSEASFDKLEKVPADMSTGTLRLSYPKVETSKSNSIISSSSKQDLPKHDYVNFTPNSSERIDSSLKSSIADDSGDYAIMCPGSSIASKPEPLKKVPTATLSANSKQIARLPIDDDLSLCAGPQSSDFTRPASKPLTVSSLLGMNNLSPSSSPSEPQNILSSSTAVTSKLLLSRQVPPGPCISERKVQNCDSDSSSISSCGTLEKASSSSSISRLDVKDSTENVTEDNVSAVTAAGPVTPVVFSSPNASPCPSPSLCSDGSSSHVSPVSPSPASAGGAGVREKKMSSGSDSSTASRDSQLLVRKYSTGSVSPSGTGAKNKGNGATGKSNNTPANRRLSCPSKSSVSRQVSLSSDVSDGSQLEESRLSEFGSSLSRQTSSSSTSGEASSSTLPLTEKRSLSCSPVPSSASPVPRPAEREINYASLDLRTGSESEDSSTRSPRGLKTQGSLSESQSSTSSPSPNPPGGTFTYAQIDFEKSEELWSASTAKGVKQ
ncbi:mucin-12 isoform X4 [Thrips palmi]|uniref:Insulin receptor substrate 1 n=1 Tax=Thrips palmi TaxID=161013 RepID=A0A6P8YZ97_THRPL|nr:mucin-12 isoform X4 [Thrips palmi]